MKNISRFIMVLLTFAFLQNIHAQSGHVGIGTTTPNYKLEVYSPIVNGVSAAFRTQGGWGEIRVGNLYGLVDLGMSDSTAGYMGTKGPADLLLRTNSSSKMIIKNPSGYIGMGTMDPRAPLHVAGASDNTSGTNIKYFNAASPNITSTTGWAGQTAIYAEGNICATESFIAGENFNFSDARIKNIIGRSDARADLNRLNRIEITRYTHKDEVAKGSDVQTKVIAQQLREVMPEAVSFTKNFIPDVMQVVASQTFDDSQNLLTLHLAKPHQLKAGDRIRCIEGDGKELIANVLAIINENNIQLQLDRQPEKLFVYGKEVNDFHVVDYNAIATLNVSATQELSREVLALKAEVERLRSQLTEMDELKGRMARLEAVLNANISSSNSTVSK